MLVVVVNIALCKAFLLGVYCVMAFILSCYTVVEVFRCQKQRVCSHDNISRLKEVFVVVR